MLAWQLWLTNFGSNTSGITSCSIGFHDIGFHCRKMSRKSYCTIVAAQQQYYLSLVSSGTVFAGKITHLLMDHPTINKTYENFSFTLAFIKGLNKDTSLSILFPTAMFSENWEFFVFKPYLLLIFLKSQSDSDVFKVEEGQTRHRQDRLCKTCFVREQN